MEIASEMKIGIIGGGISCLTTAFNIKKSGFSS